MTSTQSLFQDYASNLAAYLPQHTRHFCCPLCNTLFGQSDLCELSLEHCVPDALGGTDVTLTCK